MLPVWLTAGWLLVNLLQGIFTELFHDEAYYWLYGQHLDWGYFEHAPMIGLMTWLGSSVLPGEIGVRIFPVLFGAGTLWITWQLTDRKNPAFFFFMAFSMVLVHVGGFFAAPDSPYIFFTALFLYQYKQYLEKESLKNILLLALVVTLLMYSKYHGAMVLFFTILSNLQLLKKGSFWVIVGISVILFLPHLRWLYVNHFGTFTYHILQRPEGRFPFETPLNFLLGQLLFAGPLVSIPVLLAIFRAKAGRDPFVKTMKFIFLGITGFLFLFSFRGWIEANWAAGAYIPGMVLAYGYLETNPSLKQWVVRLGIPSILLFLVLRVFLVVNFLPGLRQLRPEFHGWDVWAEKVSKLANGRPVAFTDSYQLPSKYAFYSGNPTHALNSVYYHTNSFDLWGGEELIHGHDILYMAKHRFSDCDSLVMPSGDKFFYRFVDNFQVMSRLQLEGVQLPEVVSADSIFELKISIINQYNHPVRLDGNPEIPVYLNTIFFEGKKTVRASRAKLPLSGSVEPGETIEGLIRVNTPKKPGSYRFIITCMYDWYYPAIQGSWQQIEVVD